jgi:hypothetical protein
MSDINVRKELVEAIKDKGQDVNKFTNQAIETALKEKPVRKRRQTRYGGDCFCDDHCANQ